MITLREEVNRDLYKYSQKGAKRFLSLPSFLLPLSSARASLFVRWEIVCSGDGGCDRECIDQHRCCCD